VLTNREKAIEQGLDISMMSVEVDPQDLQWDCQEGFENGLCAEGVIPEEALDNLLNELDRL
jgi:hypothetical protein